MGQEAKKKGSNKFKNVLWDYYITNRAITAAYDEENKGEKRKWGGNEKLYLAVIIVGAVILAVKYFIF